MADQIETCSNPECAQTFLVLGAYKTYCMKRWGKIFCAHCERKL